MPPQEASEESKERLPGHQSVYSNPLVKNEHPSETNMKSAPVLEGTSGSTLAI